MKSKTKIHFEISERKVLLRVFDVVFVLLILHLLGISLDFYYFKISETNFYWTIILSLYILFFGSVFEMYNLQTASNQFQITKSIILTSSSTVLFYLLTPILTPPLPENRFQIVLFFAAVFAALYFWRILYVQFFASTRFRKKVLIVCDKDQLNDLVAGLQNVDPHYKIEAFINLDFENKNTKQDNFIKEISLQDCKKYIKNNNISEVVLASQKVNQVTVDLYNILINLLEKGVVIRDYTQVYESITQRIPLQFLTKDFYSFFPFSRNNQNQFYLIVVRFFEIFLSFIGLFIGFILLPLIYLGNLLGNRGATFYTQERIGKNGKKFKIFKLRSMIVDAEKHGAVFATNNDVRVTSFGKFLRKSRLDEVPQFINILLGDMSIIGPRPERPVFVKEIAAVMPFYETRHIIKPGLTGWAQVNYSYGQNLEDSLIKLQYDLYYIKHRSIFLDLNIIVKTISTILFYKGQ